MNSIEKNNAGNCKISVFYFMNGNYINYVNIGVLTTALEHAGYICDVYYVDENSIEKHLNSLDREIYHIVFVYFGHGFYNDCVKLCKEIKKTFESTIIFFNNLSTAFGDKLLESIDCADIAIRGEYDKTAVDLCNLIVNREDIKQCLGIWLKDKLGNIVFTGHQSVIEDLDLLWLPDREKLPHGNLFHIIGSRGCEGYCSFCAWNSIYYKSIGKQRFRSINNIVGEIDNLVETYDCRYVGFSDSTFCSQDSCHQRLTELYNELSNKKYFVQFFINLRSEQINMTTVEIIKNLAKVGLGRVFIGIESFNEKDLILYNKKAKLQDNLTAVSCLSSLNYGNEYMIDIDYGFILFNPYSTQDDVCNNINILRQNKILITPNIVSNMECNYLTPITKKLDNENLLIKNLKDMDIDEITSLSYGYHFMDSKVEAMFDVLVKLYLYLDISLPGNVPFLRNRCYHFFGYTEFVKHTDEVYLTWRTHLSEFCYKLLEFVAKNDSYNVECCLDMGKTLCDDFLLNFEKVNVQMKRAIFRLTVELVKIGEMIYE